MSSGDGLPMHSCCSCVGEVETLERKLKALRNQAHDSTVLQVLKYPTCMRNAFSLAAFQWYGNELDVYVLILLTILDGFPGFLGMVTHVQTVDTRPLSLLPCGLGTWLEEGLTPPACHTHIIHRGKECAGMFLTYKLPSLSRV